MGGGETNSGKVFWISLPFQIHSAYLCGQIQFKNRPWKLLLPFTVDTASCLSQVESSLLPYSWKSNLFTVLDHSIKTIHISVHLCGGRGVGVARQPSSAEKMQVISTRWSFQRNCSFLSPRDICWEATVFLIQRARLSWLRTTVFPCLFPPFFLPRTGIWCLEVEYPSCNPWGQTPPVLPQGACRHPWASAWTTTLYDCQIKHHLPSYISAWDILY